MDNVSIRKKIKGVSLLKCRNVGSFPYDIVPTLDNDTFAIINTQPSNMHGEHWIMIAKFPHEFCFADFLGRKMYRIPKQH